jgi:rhodanese-related sulfurtransferase
MAGSTTAEVLDAANGSNRLSAVEELVERARRRLRRVSPEEAYILAEGGGLLVDTRPVAQRELYGAIPGALVIERNVLEWRLDPSSPHRHPAAGGLGPVVVFCQEGYASSLAAASLHDIGLTQATDLIGGFESWAAAGLPTVEVVPGR